MAGVAENVRQNEGKNVPSGQSPVDDLLESGGSFAEVLDYEFEEGQELQCPEGEAKKGQQEEPGGCIPKRAQDASGWALRITRRSRPRAGGLVYGFGSGPESPPCNEESRGGV